MINYISAFKSQMTFMELHSEADNAKNESSVESNNGWILTKDQTELNSKQCHETYSSPQTGTKVLMWKKIKVIPANRDTQLSELEPESFYKLF